MRQFTRIQLNSIAVINEPDCRIRIQLKDFSQMGLGFVCEREIKLNTFLSIVYQNENGHFIQMKTYVKNSKKLTANTFRIGVQFVAIESKYDAKTGHAI